MASTFDFLGLPEVVKIEVLKILDLSSLMNIRLTCRELKSIVEQPQVFQNFQITIKSSKQLKRILESDVPYNNVILKFTSLEDQIHLRNFAEKRGDHIRELRIKSLGGGNAIFQLMLHCKNLRVLEIRSLSVAFFQRNSSHFDIILGNFSTLQKLSILDVTGNTGFEQVSFFHQLLNNCKQLTEFTIPSIKGYNEKLLTRQNVLRLPVRQARQVNHSDRDRDVYEIWDWEDGEDEEDDIPDPLPEWDEASRQDILIGPILDYIKMKKNSKLPLVKRISIQRLTLLEQDTLQNLMQLCYEYNVKLRGFQSSQFAFIKNGISFTNPGYDSVIESATIYTQHFDLPIPPLESLKQLKVHINPTYRNDRVQQIPSLSLPHLKKLHVEFIFGTDCLQSKRIIKELFIQIQRPSVRKLRLEWHLHYRCGMVRAVNLANNFKHITELEIHCWDAEESEYCKLWKNMLDLEFVTIKDCRHLSNKSFIEHFDGKPDKKVQLQPFNQLKKLQSLILRVTSDKVDEVAIIRSFKWLKLKRFEFERTTIKQIREDVYWSLSSAPLGKTVEYFAAPSPRTVSGFFKEKKFRKSLKNLKRCVFW